MEALFESINVRDLLSATDLSDPTTPLSAPDLRLLINKLESHSLQIKSKVQTYLLSHHNDFSRLFSLCNDAVSKSNVISHDFQNLLESLSQNSPDVEIKELVKEVEKTVKDTKVKRELLDVVRVVSELSERLERVTEGIKGRKLLFVAKEVRDLKLALRVGDKERGEPIVYGVLRNEWSDCFDEIQEVLGRFMGDAVRFEQESSKVRVKYRLSVDGVDEGVDLRTVQEAMDVVGSLDYGLAKVADLIIKHVITPVVTCGSSISSVEEPAQDAKDINEATLQILQSWNSKMENLDPEKIFLEIIRVVKFICKCICFESGSWIQCFGRLTWPRMSELIISQVLSKIVPKDAMKLVDFEKIIKLTSDFETTLKETKFISASDNKDERLSSFAENVEIHFASRKKAELLSKARKLLLKCEFSTPQNYQRTGSTVKNAMAISDHIVDLLFLSERCVVSEAASELMKLVHQTLQDACFSSTRVALEFYRAARDAILLYEAIIPVKLERQLDGINQVAVLVHNDCIYLSQEILGLAFEYRSYLPNAVQDYAIFVDMSPRFQQRGEEILQRQIQLVINNLKEAIDGADGFQNTHQIRQFESAKFSIDQVIFVLEKVRIIWEPLLIPCTYQRSMSSVLDSVFSRITRDMLLLDDIAAEETLQLQTLINLLLENLSSLLDSIVAVNEHRKLQEKSAIMLDNLIPSLFKIRKLAELLDMPLKSITAAWETGELVACGFVLSEVKDFIRAIFAESPLRKECLWRIENSSF